MAILDDGAGNIILYAGDSGYITFEIDGIEPGVNYRAYFSIYNESGKQIGDQIQSTNFGGEIVKFFISSQLTNLLKTQGIQEPSTYYYGVKLCYTDSQGEVIENTLNIENGEMGSLNTVTVYPKKTEGD